MKKFLGIIIGLFIGVASLFTPFMRNTRFICGSTAKLASADESGNFTTNCTKILESMAITQPKYTFKISDFLTRTITYDGTTKQDVYCLYVNTAVTFTATKNTDIWITDSLHKATTPNTGELKLNKSSFNIEFDGDEELTHEIYISKTENATTYTITFYLIQTPVHFKTDSYYSWTSSTNNEILAPASEYKSINLLVNDNVGTKNSPIFIDFYFNGEFYSLYKIEDTIYNQLTDNPIKSDNNKLLFNQPGQYSIYIYDLTCTRAINKKSIEIPTTEETKTIVSFSLASITRSPTSNCDTFSFSISNNDLGGENIYIIATTGSRSKSSVINSQIVNRSVELQFYNLTSTYVGKIIVEKSHTNINGSTSTTTEILYASDYSSGGNVNTDIGKLKNSPVTYSEDNIYTVKVFNSDSTQVMYSFTFTILTGIHSSYGNISSIDQEPNITNEVSQEKIIAHSFSSIEEIVDDSTVKLQSYTSNKYIVKIARTNCSIDGIADGSNTQDNVTVTIHGVGTITTLIYRDGILIATEYLADGSQYTVSTPGKYKIVTTDELNTTIYKTFTIVQELSASTVILICVGVVGLLVFLVLVTRARTKIKVR